MMKRVCIHWTAGGYYPNAIDRRHYHFMVDAMGNVSPGIFKPQDNIPPLYYERYAAHCGGGNSYTIGIGLCGMSGYASPKNIGKYPLTEKQCESAWAFVAKQCKEFRIPITADTVYTHYEFGKANPNSDSAGKIDITCLPYKLELKPGEIGDYMRGKVRWYYAKL